MTGPADEEAIAELFRNPPVLLTERLILRRIQKSDESDMYEYASQREVVKYLTWEAHSSPRETKYRLNLMDREYKKGRFYDWAVVLRDGGGEGKMIGTCGFTSFDFRNRSCEVGYVINPAFSGHGYAPEALCRVLRFAFCELEMHRAEARYVIDNVRSRRVMEKCGMRFEGVRRDGAIIHGRYADVGVCSILAGEFLGRF